ncbi:MAG: glycosyltransferase family 4 protein [Candidatus Hydrogenedentes bacterium]|nr:glycosyltransferase family 4 protein [Candidatus Hydrogenedentota bacterium]
MGSNVEIPPHRSLRLMIVDPIGHVLGGHDHAICHQLSEWGHEIVLATNEDYPFAHANDHHFIHIPAFRGVVGDGRRVRKGLNYLLSVFRVIRQTARMRPDAVVLYYHLEPRVDRWWVRYLARRGIRTLVCAHDVVPLDSKADAHSAYRSLYQSAWAVLAFSQFARGELVNTLGIPASKVNVLYFGANGRGNGAQVSGVAKIAGARERLGILPQEKVILCFGQIKKNKGLGFLLRAFAEVLREIPQARLLIIGRPWKVDVEPFRRQAVELGISQRVIFRPELVPDCEVSQYFSAADVVVLPYTYLYQSAVLPLACTLGKPVVATRVGNIPEVLEDGETGYLAPPADVKELRRALLEALMNPTEAARRAQRAQQVVHEKYCWTSFCQGLVEMIQNGRHSVESR